MTTAIQEYLEGITPGDICTVFSPDPFQVVSAIELCAAHPDRYLQYVLCSLSPLPDVDTLLSRALDALAAAAQAIFPTWYGRELSLVPDPGVSVKSQLDASANAELHSLPGLSIPWLQKAVRLCQHGRPPLPRGYPKQLQAAQLALALSPESLCLGLIVEETSPARDRLLGLSKAAEWLARVTRARIMVLLPQALSGLEEVQPIAYTSLFFSPWQSTADSAQPSPAPENKHSLWPILGSPHPFSPGEQLLAAYLARDPDLAQLFHFNQPVCTVRNSRFIVDLVWAEGKVAVEVDGYATHSSKLAFNQDRQRDYELVLSGYLVLRLPHDEVTADPGQAVQKIRDVVALRRGREPLVGAI